MKIQRGQFGPVKDVFDLRAADGQAGNGVYFFKPSPAMKSYYTKRGENLITATVDENKIADMDKHRDEIIAIANHTVHPNRKYRANKSNYQSYKFAVQQIFIRDYRDKGYIGFSIQHKGEGIPTGKQIVIMDVMHLNNLVVSDN